MTGALKPVGREGVPISVLVIDDHQMVAESILRMLGHEGDMNVVGVATTATAGLVLARDHQPDVVIMDYDLPDLDGVSAARLVRHCSPATNVVMLTGGGGEEMLAAAIEAGCTGYLDKTRAFEELTNAVRLAAAGEIVLPRGQLARLLPRLIRGTPAAPVLGDLTTREREVLGLIAEGLANKAIAVRLGLRLNTVRNHVQNVLVKLDAHSKLAAVAIASRHGLLGPEGDDAKRPTRRVS
jgi:NarL family two-component system response regulator LiaR